MNARSYARYHLEEAAADETRASHLEFEARLGIAAALVFAITTTTAMHFEIVSVAAASLFFCAAFLGVAWTASQDIRSLKRPHIMKTEHGDSLDLAGTLAEEPRIIYGHDLRAVQDEAER